ncbi:MAG: hypothetical protein GWN47_03740 [Woeseiaceae bacterium]|nr:hypothetical protein [Woeseiaceae bacterium]
MHPWILYLTAPAALVVSHAAEAETALLEASANTVKVTVAPLADGKEFVRLPALEFDLAIKAECPATAVPESLSISVADTRKSFGADEIGGIVETRLALPRRQSAYLRVVDFCREDDDSGTPCSRIVADVFTARLSLRCNEEGVQSIVYTTLPLDVELQCEIEDEPEIQDASFSEAGASF